MKGDRVPLAVQAARKKVYARAWADKHRAERAAYYNAYYLRNKEKFGARFKAYQRGYYLTHKDQYREAHRKYVIKNRDVIKVARIMNVSMAQARLLLKMPPPARNYNRTGATT